MKTSDNGPGTCGVCLFLSGWKWRCACEGMIGCVKGCVKGFPSLSNYSIKFA